MESNAAARSTLIIGSSNFSRNLRQIGTRGRGVRRLTPKCCALAVTPGADRPVSVDVGSSSWTSRRVRMINSLAATRSLRSATVGRHALRSEDFASRLNEDDSLLFQHFLAFLVRHVGDLVLEF